MAEELLTLSLDGLPQWEQLTQDMISRTEDLSEVWETGDEAFRLEMSAQFESQGGYLQDGTQWVPLSFAYAKRKPPPPAPFGILYRSGKLWQSLAKEGGDHVKIVQPESLVVGSSVPYGKYHQTGGGKLPQRKIIIVRDALKRLLMRGIIGYILTGKRPGAREG